MFLSVAVANSEFMIPRAIRKLAAGPLVPHADIHQVCTLFRQRGVAALLLEGTADGYHTNAMQSAAAFAMELARVSDDVKITSFARPLFDAVGSGYWDCAAEIARHSRTTWNPDHEYEDDFLYIRCWFELAIAPVDAAVVEATMLRWQRVLDGAADVRLDVCRALHERDAEAFDTALRMLLDQRKRKADELVAQRAMRDETAAWVQNFALEGVALLQLAERLGVPTGTDYLHCPQVARAGSPFVFDPNAWRTVELVPTRRPTP